MYGLRKARSVLNRFSRNEDGNMALTFALTSTVVVGIMGASMDFATLSNAQKRSQSISDSTALAAAIFVKNNDRPPQNSDEGYMDESERVYTAADLGYDFKGWVEGGADKVEVRVNYDDNAKEATVTVKGATIPTFLQVINKTKLEFEAKSVVSYLEVHNKYPASIALVLDNSGSMKWDDKLALNPYYNNGWRGTSPADADERIAGLKTSVNTFTGELRSRLGTEDDGGRRTIRMGMLPYSSNIVAAGVVDMKWGYVNSTETARMVPSGSTNSNPPMQRAELWMDNENTFHRDEATSHNEDYKEPLKFVIFMSDGQNTLGSYEFYPNENAPVYWRQNSNGSFSGIWASSYNGQSGYQRGHLRRSTDRLTIDSCNDMKARGVEIFTIGYALEEGAYNANNSNSPNRAEYVNLWNQTNAYNLLQSCASKPENFVKATDGTELEEAFDTIQNAIVTELIRVKS